MARRLKPYFLPELWMTMGGRRLPHTGDGSRLGEESRDDGFEDSERGDRGLISGPPLPSSAGPGLGGGHSLAGTRAGRAAPPTKLITLAALLLLQCPKHGPPTWPLHMQCPPPGMPAPQLSLALAASPVPWHGPHPMVKIDVDRQTKTRLGHMRYRL